jgi:glycosyltransferase involved in cell wall biosynthesis
MMRLGIDGLRLVGNRLGVGRYIEYLLRCWNDSTHPFDEIAVYTPGDLDLAMNDKGRVRIEPLPSSLPAGLWEHVVLPARKPRDTVFFCPSYVVPVLSREHPTVVMHHGSYEVIPSAFAWWPRTKARLVYQSSCRRADAIITVSESSRRNIVRFYGVDEAKIRIVPPGVDDVFRRRSYFADGRPFVLFVGKMTARRHVPDLVDAFARFVRDTRAPHGLVLVGPDTVGHRLPERFASLGIADRVHWKQFATHDELVEAYNAADVFIYPSDYEGFGMPVLEAMACGTPTITLDNSAFPEFAGGIAHFARDGSSAALAAALGEVVQSPTIRAMTRRDGPARAETYRWRNIAARTMTILAEFVPR